MATNREWVDALTSEQCEAVVRAALRAGDAEGVRGALVLLAVKDPYRAEVVLETIRLGLDVASSLDGSPGDQ